MTKQEISDRIRTEMAVQRITIVKMSKLTGRSINTISKVLNNPDENYGRDLLLDICEILKLNINIEK